MSWLSDWVKKRSGEGQKVDIARQQEDYKNALQPARDMYDQIGDYAKNQLDPNSEQNLAIKNRMQTDASDQIAESTRLNERMLLNAGAGGNPNVAAVNQMKTSVDMADATNRTYQDVLHGTQENALSTLSGVASTYADMDMGAFNLKESAIDRNAAIDKSAAQWKMGMLSGGLKVAGGALMGNPGLAMSGVNQMMVQEGGYIGYSHGGEVDNPKPVGNGMSDEDTMLSMAMQNMGPNHPGPGDIVPAKLEPGEYVLNRNAVNAIGKNNLDEINNEVAPRFEDGIKMRMGGYNLG